MASIDIPIYPLNDFSVLVLLRVTDTNPTSATFGKAIPQTSGVVSCFLSQSSTPAAAAADPSLVGTAVHVKKGWWLITFDAVALDPTLMDTKFLTSPPYLIVQQTGNVRGFLKLTYTSSREMVVS